MRIIESVGAMLIVLLMVGCSRTPAGSAPPTVSRGNTSAGDGNVQASQQQTPIDTGAREGIATDWIDYTLDHQSVINTKTGEANKTNTPVAAGSGP